MKTEIVITGASGTIGRLLLDSLSHKDVIGISRKESNHQSMFNCQDFEDIPTGRIIIHLAEESDKNRANKLGDLYINESISNMKKILDKNFERVIYASSALVYSDKVSFPRTPDEAITPYDYYSEAKLLNEELVLSQNGTVARISNIIPKNIDRGVLLDIVSGFLKNSEIILKDTTPTRDFICIDDVVSCLSLMTEKDFSGIYNVGSGTVLSILELANLISDIMNIDNPIIKSISTKPISKSSIILDISNTKRVFSWRPKDDISHCLKESIERLMV